MGRIVGGRRPVSRCRQRQFCRSCQDSDDQPPREVLRHQYKAYRRSVSSKNTLSLPSRNLIGWLGIRSHTCRGYLRNLSFTFSPPIQGCKDPCPGAGAGARSSFSQVFCDFYPHYWENHCGGSGKVCKCQKTRVAGWRLGASERLDGH